MRLLLVSVSLKMLLSPSATPSSIYCGFALAKPPGAKVKQACADQGFHLFVAGLLVFFGALIFINSDAGRRKMFEAAQLDLPNSRVGPIIPHLCVAGIAQLVEQLICNQKVPSSILGAGTRDFGMPRLKSIRFAANMFDRKAQHRHN